MVFQTTTEKKKRKKKIRKRGGVRRRREPEPGRGKGDDEILKRRVNKGETWESTRSALLKIREAGLTSSVMVLNGLGGESLSRQHAINTATLCNETQPDYLSTLVVSFPQGEERFREGFGDDFVQLSQQGLFEEIRLFLEHPRPSPTLARYRFVQNGCAGCNSMNREPPL